MAAGEGTRLRPLTERWPKPVLPIDGKPVLATLLRELAAAGIERVFVVTGHLAEQVEELVGDGSAFGLDARFARQPGVLGSADTVRRGLAAGAEPPFLVVGADTVFEPGAVARFVQEVERSGADGARVAGDVAPLWAFGPALVPCLGDLGGPPYELEHAYDKGIAAGRTVAVFDIGKTRDLTHPVDLVKENFPYLGS
jgi:dTDP-glucose pyrophosphorylase